MQIEFRSALDASTPRLVARLVEQDSFPLGLARAGEEGAQAARFTGKAGQLFETFEEADGRVVRLALAGTGRADSKDRAAALEKAGAALAAKYLASGEDAIALDLGGTSLSVEEVCHVLMGLRL